MGVRRRPFPKRPLSANCFGKASANPRLHGALGLAEHRSGAYCSKKNPERDCPTQACRKDTIVRTRIPVWLLEQARRLGTTEQELLEGYPTLRAEDLVNAWSYVRGHMTEIANQIEANESA